MQDIKPLEPATNAGLVRLTISWATSKGRDTYGYNICRLDSPTKRYRTCGGNYDMVGTVLGDCFMAEYQPLLRELVKRNASLAEDCGYAAKGWKKIDRLYGMTIAPSGKVCLDGACGVESIRKIIEACGIGVQVTANRKGRIDGFLLFPREDEGMAA